MSCGIRHMKCELFLIVRHLTERPDGNLGVSQACLDSGVSSLVLSFSRQYPPLLNAAERLVQYVCLDADVCGSFDIMFPRLPLFGSTLI